MRIDCPSCAASYDVPPERLAAGRVVKCARCATTWTPIADPAPGLPEAVAKPLPEPEIERAPPEVVPEGPLQEPAAETAATLPMTGTAPEPVANPETGSIKEPVPPVRRSALPLTLAWLLTGAVLGGLAWLAVDRRGVIVQAWPPSVRAYVLLDSLTQRAVP